MDLFSLYAKPELTFTWGERLAGLMKMPGAWDLGYRGAWPIHGGLTEFASNERWVEAEIRAQVPFPTP